MNRLAFLTCIIGGILLIGVLPNVKSTKLRSKYTRKQNPLTAIRRSNNNNRVINGEEEAPGAVPYIVSLDFTGFDDTAWGCGGSIIDKNWIVTAAHCTIDAESVRVFYGATNRHRPRSTVKVYSDALHTHEEYGDTNDIALIKVPDIKFSKYVKTIALPTREDVGRTFVGEWARANGWGVTSEGGEESDVLLGIDIQVVDNDVCAEVYGEAYDTDLCCDTSHGYALCDGDSGGPLALKDDDSEGGHKLIGVIAFVDDDSCESGAPAGFTRVTEFLDWIEEKQAAN